jgi:hypothetical protein
MLHADAKRRRPRDTPHRRRFKVHAQLDGRELDLIDTESAKLGLSRGAYLRVAVMLVITQERQRRGESMTNY